jgi:hypothetical protein
MNTTFKNYQVLKISHFTKCENIFFISQGVNKNSNDRTMVDQSISKMKFNYFKVVNKIAHLTLNRSILKNTLMVYKSSIIFLNPKIKKMQKKKFLVQVFSKLMFNLLLIKLNNKIYSIENFKTAATLSYKESLFITFINKLVICKKSKIKLN